MARPYRSGSHPHTHHSVPLALWTPGPPDTYFCFLDLSQILTQAHKESSPAGDCRGRSHIQVDAVGSRLKMLERKGQLASSVGRVRSPSPGSSWLPTAELYHFFHSVGRGKTFLERACFQAPRSNIFAVVCVSVKEI